MSRPANKRGESLFYALASSGTVLLELITYWQNAKEYEQRKLGNLAISALLKPELHSHALVQYGKVQMLTELIEHANMYKK